MQNGSPEKKHSSGRMKQKSKSGNNFLCCVHRKENKSREKMDFSTRQQAQKYNQNTVPQKFLAWPSRPPLNL